MTKDNWIKAFDNHFKDLGFHNLPLHQDIRDEVKSFISQVENDAIERTNKRWRDKCKSMKKKITKEMEMELGEDYQHYEHGYNQALSDLLEDKK